MPSNLALISLPDEILLEIFSFFPKHLLLRLRCVSRTFALLATPAAFRSLRLRAYRDEPQRFIQIATSERLRSHIREVTCDTWCDPEVNRRAVWDLLADQAYSDFLAALPYITSFRNLEAFHLRFGTCEEEARIIRSTVTERVFPYLAGISLEQSFGQKARPFHRLDHPLQLKTLTISNLEDSINKKLIKSEAFQAIVSSPYLVDLRLYFATDTWSLTRSSSRKCSDQSDMFESLPYTWLRLSIAENLRVLSLYSHEPWGWFPKMDFRLVGAGDGMPNLKVLALGSYTFSHEWQVEWVGSLGIEKLYLDGCAILFQAGKRRGMLLDQSETVIQGSDGRVHTFSNSGYYVKPATPSPGNVAEAIYGTLRWHHLLSHWAESMTNLRVFKMGKGYWDDIPNEAIDPSYYERLHIMNGQETASQPFTHHGFRHFEHPSPGTTGSGIRKYGTGATGDDKDMLKYVYWTGRYIDYDDVWGRREDERKLVKEEKSRDKAALEAMISAVDARRACMNTLGTRWEV